VDQTKGGLTAEATKNMVQLPPQLLGSVWDRQTAMVTGWGMDRIGHGFDVSEKQSLTINPQNLRQFRIQVNRLEFLLDLFWDLALWKLETIFGYDRSMLSWPEMPVIL
jgi:hypothetical protein